jgi:hypothetical protein
MDSSERELSDRVAGLENRFGGFDQRLTALEQSVAVIRSNYATKADVLDTKNSIIMWVVSAVLFAQVIPTLLKAVTG